MKIVIMAPAGKMGRSIAHVATERQDIQIVAAVGRKGQPYIGSDLGQVALMGRNLDVPVVDDLELVIDQCDVVIDFSATGAAPGILRSAIQHKKALVCGTTGFTEEAFSQFVDASKEIPIVYAQNTSRMVDLLTRFVESAARELGDSADIEILDLHERTKKDAPSGTACKLGESIAAVKGTSLADIAVYGREGAAPGIPGTVGFHSVRAGDIPSSHVVYFGGLGERLELTHHAYNMDCFARGACDCAAFLMGREPGLYTARDVFSAGSAL